MEKDGKKNKKEETERRGTEEKGSRAGQMSRGNGKKAEEKANKAEEKAKKAAAAKRPPKRKPAGESSAATRSKRSRVDTSASEINPNVCCTCLVNYDQDGTGADWVSCACGRWLHEDCVLDATVNDEGKELLCPYSLNHITS